MKLDLEHFIAISRLTILKNYYNLFGGLGIEFGTKTCIGLREMILNLSKTYNLLSLPPYPYTILMQQLGRSLLIQNFLLLKMFTRIWNMHGLAMHLSRHVICEELPVVDRQASRDDRAAGERDDGIPDIPE